VDEDCGWGTAGYGERFNISMFWLWTFAAWLLVFLQLYYIRPTQTAHSWRWFLLLHGSCWMALILTVVAVSLQVFNLLRLKGEDRT
jgi:hypothetical protein